MPKTSWKLSPAGGCLRLRLGSRAISRRMERYGLLTLGALKRAEDPFYQMHAEPGPFSSVSIHGPCKKSLPDRSKGMLVTRISAGTDLKSRAARSNTR